MVVVVLSPALVPGTVNALLDEEVMTAIMPTSLDIVDVMED